MSLSGRGNQALVARVAEETKSTGREFNTVVSRGRKKFAKQRGADEYVISKHSL